MADNKLTAATFEQIATMFSHLATNYSNLAATYFTMFYDTEPKDVLLKLYDDNGQLKDYVIPNRAKDFTFCMNGEGKPEGRVAAPVGTIYQDTEGGFLFIKNSGSGVEGWEIVGIDREKEENVYLGEGSPVGRLSKAKGSLYVDSNEAALYIKGNSTGNEDWYLISANLDSVPTITLSNVTNIAETSVVANTDLSNLTQNGSRKFNEKEDKANKVTSILSSSTDIEYPSAKAVYREVNNLSNLKEDKANKVTSISSSASDTQYPTAKAIYTGYYNKTDSDNRYVNVTGDTMTGQLIVNNTINTRGYYDVNPNVTKGINPSSTQYWNLTFNDNSNSSTWQATRLGIIEQSLQTDGTNNLSILAYKNEANSSTNVGINMGFDASGTGYTRAVTPASNSNSTDIATTAWVKNVLKVLYPVGSLYITSSTTNSCPIATYFGTWELVSKNEVLQGASAVGKANTEVEAGLPDHYHDIGFTTDGGDPFGTTTATSYTLMNGYGNPPKSTKSAKTSNASKSKNIYGNSTTVQPPAYLVNVWRRTA